MMIALNGAPIRDFDFYAAACAFVGCGDGTRRHANVPSLQTSLARATSRAVISYDWSKKAALAACSAQAKTAKAAASGADITERLHVSDVKENK